jgi:hypothetical protein
MDWFQGKSKPETIDFPIQYGAFRLKFSLKPIHCREILPEFLVFLSHFWEKLAVKGPPQPRRAWAMCYGSGDPKLAGIPLQFVIGVTQLRQLPSGVWITMVIETPTI